MGVVAPSKAQLIAKAKSKAKAKPKAKAKAKPKAKPKPKPKAKATVTQSPLNEISCNGWLVANLPTPSK